MNNQEVIDLIYELKKDNEVRIPWKYQVVLSWAIAKLLVGAGKPAHPDSPVPAAARW